MNNLVNAAVVAGSAAIVGSYVDRKYGVGKDLHAAYTLLPDLIKYVRPLPSSPPYPPPETSILFFFIKIFFLSL